METTSSRRESRRSQSSFESCSPESAGLPRYIGNPVKNAHTPALSRLGRAAGAQSRLIEKAVGDFARAAAADAGDAGDRQEILDQRLGAGVIGALQRRQNARLSAETCPVTCFRLTCAISVSAPGSSFDASSTVLKVTPGTS